LIDIPKKYYKYIIAGIWIVLGVLVVLNKRAADKELNEMVQQQVQEALNEAGDTVVPKENKIAEPSVVIADEKTKVAVAAEEVPVAAKEDLVKKPSPDKAGAKPAVAEKTAELSPKTTAEAAVIDEEPGESSAITQHKAETADESAADLQKIDSEFSDEESAFAEAEDELPEEERVIDVRKEFPPMEKEAVRQLDLRFSKLYPFFRRLEEVAIVHPDGKVSSGKLTAIEKDYIEVTQGKYKEQILINTLRIHDRLRVDPVFRQGWIDALARVHTRKDLKSMGAKFTEFSGRYGPEILAPLRQGDPEAHRVVAVAYTKGYHINKNLTLAFMHNYMAAKNGHVEATFDLGRMFYKGISVERNKNIALQYLSSAKSKGHAGAGKYLEAHAVNTAQIKEALAKYEADKQAEIDEKVARLESFNKRANKRKAVKRKRLPRKIGDLKD